MDIYLARQPIFGPGTKLFAYELLFRAHRFSSFDGSDGDQASLQVLANTLLSFGPGRVLAGRPAFVNFTRGLLLGDMATILPPESLVIEVLESVAADGEVIAACERLRRQGYRIALDDFVPDGAAEPLIPLADIVKVDFRATAEPERRRLLAAHGRPGLVFLAEKVETQEEAEEARREGFRLFQGHYFARPVLLEQREIPALKTNLMRILAEAAAPEINLPRLDAIIRHEPSLCYRLLRYANSAAFTLRARVTSVRQVMALLGEDELRRWVALAALPLMGADQPGELIRAAMLRARFCELLACAAARPERRADCFLAGMFSLLDVMVGRPMPEILEEVPVTAAVRQTLLGQPGAGCSVGAIYALAAAFEESDWDAIERLSAPLGLTAAALSDHYLEATAWCGEFC